MKDCYCSGIENDTIFGVKLTECCKRHDNDSGQAGNFNFVKHSIDFYLCLKSKGLRNTQAFTIAFVATLFVVIKMPYLIYKKIKFTKQK